MRPIGFSTGSLCHSDFVAALEVLRATSATAVELSALREPELGPLMRALPQLDLTRFRHIAVHAPSQLRELNENEVVRMLEPAIDAETPIVVHADVIRDYAVWKRLGRLVLIENMDKRKDTGRTAQEIERVLQALPQARLCVDIAHARQVDPSLCELGAMLGEFGDRVAQLHLSELDAESRHEGLSHAAVSAIRSMAGLIPASAAVILEYCAAPADLDGHIEFVRGLLTAQPKVVRDAG